MDISAKVRRAYRDARISHDVDPTLADFARDTLAELMKAEFWNAPTDWVVVGMRDSDPRYDWTDTQWQEAAHKELTGDADVQRQN